MWKDLNTGRLQESWLVPRQETPGGDTCRRKSGHVASWQCEAAIQIGSCNSQNSLKLPLVFRHRSHSGVYVYMYAIAWPTDAKEETRRENGSLFNKLCQNMKGKTFWVGGQSVVPPTGVFPIAKVLVEHATARSKKTGTGTRFPDPTSVVSWFKMLQLSAKGLNGDIKIREEKQMNNVGPPGLQVWASLAKILESWSTVSRFWSQCPLTKPGHRKPQKRILTGP